MLDLERDDESSRSFDSVIGSTATENLLDFSSSLFPGGTKVFPSKFTFQRRVWTLGGALMLFCVFCITVVLISGYGTDTRAEISKAFSILLVVVGGLTALLLYYWNSMDMKMYEEKVANGLWLEGVFVFSTGDVVVRFNEMLRKVEMEFDSGTISDAYALDNILVIRYTDLTGTKQEYKVDCNKLVDSAPQIAQQINAREQDTYP